MQFINVDRGFRGPKVVEGSVVNSGLLGSGSNCSIGNGSAALTGVVRACLPACVQVGRREYARYMGFGFVATKSCYSPPPFRQQHPQPMQFSRKRGNQKCKRKLRTPALGGTLLQLVKFPPRIPDTQFVPHKFRKMKIYRERIIATNLYEPIIKFQLNFAKLFIAYQSSSESVVCKNILHTMIVCKI